MEAISAPPSASLLPPNRCLSSASASASPSCCRPAAPSPGLGLGLGLLPLKKPRLASARTSSPPRIVVASSAFTDELDVLPVASSDPTDQQQGSSLLVGLEHDDTSRSSNLGGFSPDPPFTFDLSTAAASSSGSSGNEVQVLAASQLSQGGDRQFVDRAINAVIVGAAGAFAITKILTVDHDYWHGWTVFEILKYAPLHNWSAYEEALKNNPILAKMMISGIVYSLGDWIAQCYEGKPILDFSRERMIRSGLVGFCLHGSLSHFYYHLCEALFPFKDWWVVPLKVAFDQTIWSGFWNSIYFITLGLLRLESPATIASELRATFWPLLTAGWKLWPFAHLVTYGLIPVEQRLLWVDCVELVWVTILSMYSNEKAEARILEAANDAATLNSQDAGLTAASIDANHEEQ